MASVSLTSRMGLRLAGMKSVTSLRRLAPAPRQISVAAPVFPTEPESTATCPAVPLWLSAGRGCNHPEASSSSSQKRLIPFASARHRRNPDIHHMELPRILLTGSDHMTHFEKPKGGCSLRPNRSSKGFPGAGIKPRRDIHRKHRHRKRIQALR